MKAPYTWKRGGQRVFKETLSGPARSCELKTAENALPVPIVSLISVEQWRARARLSRENESPRGSPVRHSCNFLFSRVQKFSRNKADRCSSRFLHQRVRVRGDSRPSSRQIGRSTLTFRATELTLGFPSAQICATSSPKCLPREAPGGARGGGQAGCPLNPRDRSV